MTSIKKLIAITYVGLIAGITAYLAGYPLPQVGLSEMFYGLLGVLYAGIMENIENDRR